MIKNIMATILNMHLVIMWLIMLPFVYLFDQIFGGWSKDKIESIKDNEKKKHNIK